MRPLLLSFMLLACALSLRVHADQTDPRLDALFQELLRTQDAGKAAFLQAGIWHVWYDTQDPVARDMMSRGVQSLVADRYPEAIEIFTALIDHAPHYAEAWNRRATTYYLMGRYQNSLADIDKVLQLEPRHFGALSGRGLCLRELGRLSEAVKALRAALTVDPHLEEVQLEIIRLEARIRQHQS